MGIYSVINEWRFVHKYDMCGRTTYTSIIFKNGFPQFPSTGNYFRPLPPPNLSVSKIYF